MPLVQVRMRGVLGGVLGLIVGLLVTSPAAVAALSMLPVISILAPIQNQTVTGQVSFYATSDSAGVVGLQFKVDGVNLGSEITSGACRASWNSAQTNDGLHTVQAVARDQYNNLSIAQPITVLVSNPIVPILNTVTVTSPTAGMTISGTQDIVVNFTGSITASSVTVQVRTTSGATATTLSTKNSQGAGWVSFRPNLTTLVANGQYDLVSASGSVYSAPVRVTVSGSTVVPPATTLAISAPAPGSTLSSTTELVVNFTGSISASTVTLQVRTTAGAIAKTISTIDGQGAGWVTFRQNLATLVANGQYDLVAVSGSISSLPVRVTVSGLTMTLQTTGGRDFVLTATLKQGSTAVPGVIVTFVVTSSQSSSTYKVTTNSSGVATYKGRLSATAIRGMYIVMANASYIGLSASAWGMFTY